MDAPQLNTKILGLHSPLAGKQRTEKCEYCGSVSDEKVEKFFHDLFKAGVAITLCNGLVVVPLWWWTLRRRPFLDTNSWANVQVEGPAVTGAPPTQKPI